MRMREYREILLNTVQRRQATYSVRNREYREILLNTVQRRQKPGTFSSSAITVVFIESHQVVLPRCCYSVIIIIKKHKKKPNMFWIISLLALLLISFIFVDRVLRSFKVGNYQDKYVFITGCDSGFGQGLACHLDRLGFHVFAGCLTDEGRTYLKEQCSGRLLTILLDVSKNQSIEEALQEVKRSLPEGKGLWGLVNNAGILGHVGFNEVSTREDYQKVLDVNVLGLIQMTHTFLPLVRKSKGRVVNMASISGRVAIPFGPYCLSKFGVEAYSDMLRRELYHRGIKVCLIEPSGFITPMTDMDKMKADAEALFHDRATDEMKQFYGNVPAIYDQIFSAKACNFAPDISPVVEAYTHALTSRYPKTRYSVGREAKLTYIPLSYLPTFIADRILAMPYL
ncbi:Retinol dehydrogenase 7 [Bulinus truncatus]|nr:Retinol dehydrogenase 7 [Bulinus truncatus]